MSSPLSALPIDPFHSPELYLTSLFDPHSATTLLTFPPSPSDTVSSISTEPPQTPISRPHSAPLHVVCTAPLVAPIPLPYHSPTFLQFDLPDIDEDLSQPAYIASAVRRNHNNHGTIIHTSNNNTKRKRENDQSDPDLPDSDIIMAPPPAKRPFVQVQQHHQQQQQQQQQQYQDQYPHHHHRQAPRQQRQQHSRSNPSTPSFASDSSITVTGSRRRQFPQQHVDQREPHSYSASYLNLRRNAMLQLQQQPPPQLQQLCQPGLPHGQQFYLSQFQFQYPFQPQFQHQHHYHHSPHQIQQRSF